MISNFGHITTYSFQAIKHITSVDGGALVVPHSELYRRGKLLRWYGINREEARTDFRCEADIEEVGTKWHMNDVNAAIGIENLKHAPTILGRNKANAAFYSEQLKHVTGVTLLNVDPLADSVYWLYTIKVERREAFMKAMTAAGITTSRVHERNDKHSALCEYAAQLPTLDRVVREMICIPVGFWVSGEDRQHIVDTIKGGW
jgi:dTDP-4-amino-4,6-dideoxygalactose transaminase